MFQQGRGLGTIRGAPDGVDLTHSGLKPGSGFYHCDNPPCCNPRHLYVGDHRQNIRDMKDGSGPARPR